MRKDACSTMIKMDPDIEGWDLKEAQPEGERTRTPAWNNEQEERDPVKRGDRQPEVEFDRPARVGSSIGTGSVPNYKANLDSPKTGEKAVDLDATTPEVEGLIRRVFRGEVSTEGKGKEMNKENVC
ncbi:hypothetical protein NDU88_010091 [Pleurodeles waltl]|uniref:Uncharacterized protein n=1 Tax=Pleurodeles waltl TaxID=8319 RepID=A0AAV7Q0X5_PLEWA|nr:hypothetical protein NDU88_010091 [Pleurodeles waltl]